VGEAPEGCRQHGRLWAPLWKCLGWLWVGHCCPPMHKRVEKTVLSPCTVPIFRWGSLNPSLSKQLPAECRDYCQLINGWVCFESWTCRGWLQEHLYEVWGLNFFPWRSLLAYTWIKLTISLVLNSSGNGLRSC